LQRHSVISEAGSAHGMTEPTRGGRHLASGTAVDATKLLADVKVDGVLRLLRGEQLGAIAEELAVPPDRLLAWRDAFLLGGQERLALLDETAGAAPARPAWNQLIRRDPLRSLPGARPSRLPWMLILGGLLVVLLVVVVELRTADLERGWHVVYDGYGKAGVEKTEDGKQVHYLAPGRAEQPKETHAALKTSSKRYGDLELTLRVRTVRQLRQGGVPNPWETAWILWHYQDDQHFYYLALKPNGWEVGKRDPAYPGNQRFLVSDKVPVYYFNTWYDVRVVHVGSTMFVQVNGLPLARFTDQDSPYGSGRVGLYTEDAYAQFADVKMGEADPAMLPPPSSGPASVG
jgi:hypothetical protein